MKAPRTWFSTSLRGDARSLRRRFAVLFHPGVRRGRALVVAVRLLPPVNLSLPEPLVELTPRSGHLVQNPAAPGGGGPLVQSPGVVDAPRGARRPGPRLQRRRAPRPAAEGPGSLRRRYSGRRPPEQLNETPARQMPCGRF